MVSTTGKKPVFAPYSIVPVGTGSLVYVSGQIARDPRLISVGEQSKAIFDKIAEILGGLGGNFENVVRINAYLTDIREYEEYNEVRRGIWSGSTLPASTSVGVDHLMNPFNKIEIDAIAYLPSK